MGKNYLESFLDSRRFFLEARLWAWAWGSGSEVWVIFIWICWVEAGDRGLEFSVGLGSSHFFGFVGILDPAFMTFWVKLCEISEVRPV